MCTEAAKETIQQQVCGQTPPAAALVVISDSDGESAVPGRVAGKSTDAPVRVQATPLHQLKWVRHGSLDQLEPQQSVQLFVPSRRVVATIAAHAFGTHMYARGGGRRDAGRPGQGWKMQETQACPGARTNGDRGGALLRYCLACSLRLKTCVRVCRNRVAHMDS